MIAKRRVVERAVFPVIELLAWVALLSVAVSLGTNWEPVAKLLTGRVFWDHMSAEEVTPRELHQFLVEQGQRCGQVAAGSGLTLRRHGETFGGTYDFYYHTKIDKTRFLSRTFDRDGAGAQLSTPIWRGFSECISDAFFEEFHLKKMNRIDSRILWVYYFLDAGLKGELVVWPDTIVPKTFDPWRRPWSKENLGKRHRKKEEIEGGSLYETFAYLDAVSNEHVASLAMPIPLEREGENLELNVVVDLRIGTTPSVYAGMVFLNLVTCIACAVLASFGRKFSIFYVRTWYRAWLSLAVLYSLLAYQYFSEHPSSVLVDERRFLLLVSLLSVANNVFFLQTALSIQHPGSERRSRKVGYGIGILAMAILIMLSLWDVSLFRLPARELVEALFSASVFCYLGVGLASVLRRCSGNVEPLLFQWSRTGSILVVLIFLGISLQQLTIPWWPVRPALHDFFYIMSIPSKVTLFAMFYIVLLVEFYWRKVNANKLFVDNLRKAVIVADQKFRVVNLNNFAVEMVGLPVEAIQGRHLNSVFFRLLHEAESIYCELRKGESVKDREVHGKSFQGTVENIVEEERLVSAYPTSRGIAGQDAFLFVVSREE